MENQLDHSLFFNQLFPPLVQLTLLIFAHVYLHDMNKIPSFSNDLGTHSSLKGNLRALATVTAIIDGTGSVGAALGPLLTGFISTDGWNGVFIMLTLSSLISGLLSRMVVAEIVDKIAKAKERFRQQEIAGNTQGLYIYIYLNSLWSCNVGFIEYT